MMLSRNCSITSALTLMKQGGVIAYPTEAVYGLGCDPFNQHAVNHLLHLKQRCVSKGLILLIADWKQLTPLIQSIDARALASVEATWPGPTTWLFPKSSLVPLWISGFSDKVAIRMSAHPIAHALCQHGPVVSTSANVSGEEPARNESTLDSQFPEGLAGIVQGDLGSEAKPSRIFDLLSGKQLR